MLKLHVYSQSGDLDHRTRQLLDQLGTDASRAAIVAKLVAFDRKQVELAPGTVLMREWNDQPQRVMVMAQGFAWNGVSSTCFRSKATSLETIAARDVRQV